MAATKNKNANGPANIYSMWRLATNFYLFNCESFCLSQHVQCGGLLLTTGIIYILRMDLPVSNRPQIFRGKRREGWCPGESGRLTERAHVQAVNKLVQGLRHLGLCQQAEAEAVHSQRHGQRSAIFSHLTTSNLNTARATC